MRDHLHRSDNQIGVGPIQAFALGPVQVVTPTLKACTHAGRTAAVRCCSGLVKCAGVPAPSARDGSIAGLRADRPAQERLSARVSAQTPTSLVDFSSSETDRAARIPSVIS